MSLFQTITGLRRTTRRPTFSPTSREDALRILLGLGFDEDDLDEVQAGEVFVPNRNLYMPASTAVQTACETFADQHDIAVFVCNPHGRPSEPVSYPGTVHIRFYSTVIATRPTRLPSNLFGAMCQLEQREAVLPSGQGVALRDRYGNIVAEVINNTVFVLFDLPHCSSDDCPHVTNVLGQILQDAIPHLDIPEEQIDLVEMTPEQVRAAFIAGAAQISTNRVATTATALRAAEEKVAEIAASLMNAARAREAILFDKWRLTEGAAEVMTEQFDALVALPEVARVELGSDTIHVFTHPISVTHEDVIYDIGEFRISLNLKPRGQREDIGRALQIRNLTNPREGYPHPHVNYDGTPCLGNIQGFVTELVDQGLLLDTIQLLLSYLTSYNPASPYVMIDAWRNTPIAHTRGRR